MNRLTYTFKCFCSLIVMIFFVTQSNGQLMTQAGIGALYIQGDVDEVFDPLNSFHFGISKTLKNNFTAELKAGFGKAVGLSGVYMQSGDYGGGLVEEAYSVMNDEVWYPNYLTNYVYIDLGVNYILNTGLERLRFIGGLGLGISNSTTNINLLFSEENLNYTIELSDMTPIDEAKKQINRLYDSSYETSFDETGIIPHLSMQFGVQFKITRGIYFTLDARHHITSTDYLDPIKFNSATEDSNNNDSVSMLTLGFVGYLLQDDSDEKAKQLTIDN